MLPKHEDMVGWGKWKGERSLGMEPMDKFFIWIHFHNLPLIIIKASHTSVAYNPLELKVIKPLLPTYLEIRDT